MLSIVTNGIDLQSLLFAGFCYTCPCSFGGQIRADQCFCKKIPHLNERLTRFKAGLNEQLKNLSKWLTKMICCRYWGYWEIVALLPHLLLHCSATQAIVSNSEHWAIGKSIFKNWDFEQSLGFSILSRIIRIIKNWEFEQSSGSISLQCKWQGQRRALQVGYHLLHQSMLSM